MRMRHAAHGASSIQPRQWLEEREMRTSGSKDWVVVKKKKRYGRHVMWGKGRRGMKKGKMVEEHMELRHNKILKEKPVRSLMSELSLNLNLPQVPKPSQIGLISRPRQGPRALDGFEPRKPSHCQNGYHGRSNGPKPTKT